MDSTRIGPERVAVLPVVVLAFGTLPLAGSAPVLAPLVLLPLAALVWVLRARVVADAHGLEVCNGLAARRYAWAQVAGFDVPRRRFVRLLLDGGHSVPLTALPRRRLPDVVRVGGTSAA